MQIDDRVFKNLAYHNNCCWFFIWLSKKCEENDNYFKASYKELAEGAFQKPGKYNKSIIISLIKTLVRNNMLRIYNPKESNVRKTYSIKDPSEWDFVNEKVNFNKMDFSDMEDMSKEPKMTEERTFSVFRELEDDTEANLDIDDEALDKFNFNEFIGK